MGNAAPDLRQLVDLAAWHRGQVAQFVKFREEELGPAAAQIKGVLEAIAQHTAPEARVAVRVKSVLSVSEKVLRDDNPARHPDPLDVHRGLSDLIGGQLITYSQRDADRICAFIEQLGRSTEADRLEIDFESSVDTQTRLKPSEFGYTSRHFIARFIGAALLGKPINHASASGRKFEIQVCPTLAHAWGAVTHDRVYKGDLILSEEMQRQVAAVKAMLDTAQRQLDQTLVALDAYRRKHAGRLYSEVREQENFDTAVNSFTKARLVCESTLANTPPGDEAHISAAETLAELAAAQRDWGTSARLLREITPVRPILRTRLAETMLRLGQRPQGEKLLNEILNEEPTNGDAASAMATLLFSDNTADAFARAAGALKPAFNLNPHDPRLLIATTTAMFLCDRRLDRVELLTGALDDAIAECSKRLDLGCDVPNCLFQSARLWLYRGDVFASMNHYCLASVKRASPEALSDEWSIVRQLRDVLAGAPPSRQGNDMLAALECADELLTLLLHKDAAPSPLGFPEAPDFRDRPILILAGGCDDRHESHVEFYAPLLHDAFARFRGTIISGGTTAGISRIAGDIAAEHPKQVRAIGYLPALERVIVNEQVVDRVVGTQDLADNRYERIVPVRSSRPHAQPIYSPLGPIRTWQHLLAARVKPDEVRVVGVNGGAVSGFEFRLAVTLGATAGLIENSGRAVSSLLTDRHWKDKQGVVRLPNDRATVEMFVNVHAKPLGTAVSQMSKSQMEHLAETFHEEYRQSGLKKPEYVDASVLEWGPSLPEIYKDSSINQVAAMQWILSTEDFAIVPADQGPRPAIDLGVPNAADPKNPQCNPRYKTRLDRIARLEHGRWMAERLSKGFRYGSARSLKDKTNPNIVPWERLPEETQRYDYAPYLHLAGTLKALHLKVVDLKPGDDETSL
jgi:ppGpp synthetase/RelA/SpoT-type nucleotidyltranferase